MKKESQLAKNIKLGNKLFFIKAGLGRKWKQKTIDRIFVRFLPLSTPKYFYIAMVDLIYLATKFCLATAELAV